MTHFVCQLSRMSPDLRFLLRLTVMTYHSIDNLSIEYKKVGEAHIQVKFARTDNAPGGSPTYLIDGKNGEILEAHASQ